MQIVQNLYNTLPLRQIKNERIPFLRLNFGKLYYDEVDFSERKRRFIKR